MSREDSSDCQVSGSCNGVCYVWSVGWCLSAAVAPPTLGLPWGLRVPRRSPEDLFLVQVGELVPSALSIRRLDHGPVPLDSKARDVGDSASGRTA